MTSASPAQTTRGVEGVLFHYWYNDDGTMRLEFTSEGAEDLLEQTAAEIDYQLAHRSLPLIGVDPRSFYDSIEKALRQFTSWSYRFGFIGPKTQRIRWLQCQGFPRQTPSGKRYFDAVLIDITPLVIAEAESRQAYQTLFQHTDNTPLGVIEWDADWRVKRWNNQAEAIFGWSYDDVRGKRPDEWRFVHEADVSRIGDVMQKLQSNQLPRNVERNRNYTKAGEVRHCEWRNSIQTDTSGRFRSCLSMVQDITESVWATDQLRRSESRLKLALSAATMFSWDVNPRTRVYVASTDYHRFFGGHGTMTFDNLMDVVHVDDWTLVQNGIAHTLTTGEPFHVRFRGAHPDDRGRTRWFDSRGMVLGDPEGEIRMVGVTADVTERHYAEEERRNLHRILLENQKYESLGLLAGGIAHDFNNLLTVILGNSALAHQTIPKSNDAHSRLAQIEAACQRATAVCRQMLAYAGRTQVEPKPIDLNVLVTDSLELLRSAAGRRAHLEIVTHESLPLIHAEPQPLQQVLLNLAANAGEALIESGGRVIVSLGLESLRATDPQTTPVLPAGEYIYVDVIDTGGGMTAEVKAKMFDPFFSTKFAGRGLGLAAVIGVVRAHNGGVRVTSEPMFGTCIRVLLPVTSSKKRP